MTGENIQRVRMYVSEDDIWQGKPLYQVVLEYLQQEGATGATVLQGVTGFGPGGRSMIGSSPTLRTSPLDRFLPNRDAPQAAARAAPLVIEWIDRAERVARLLPTLTEMLEHALVTLEEVQIYHAVLRSRGPLATEQDVGSMMHADVQQLPPDATLGQAIDLLLQHQQQTMPVVDEEGVLLGTITERELHTRVGLALPLLLLALLDEHERQLTLAPFALRPLHEIMNSEPRSVSQNGEFAHALRIMIEWNYEQLPVIGRDGTCAGLVGTTDMLHTVVEQATQASNIKEANPPTPVQLIMQQTVPRIGLFRPFNQVLRVLVATSHRFLVVVDEHGQVRGSVSDIDVLQRLTGEERAAWLAALRDTSMQQELLNSGAILPDTATRLEDVMQHEVPTLAPETSLLDATRRLLELQVERMIVVDEENKLLGMVGRSSLLRALLQESE